jgi:transketolase
MAKTRIKELRLIAQELRITGLKMVRHARSGHIGGAFSLSEILAVLYFEKMRCDPKNPGWEDRDRMVMSKGHATVALYAALAKRGFFPVEDLDGFRRIESRLSGHAERHVPGVDMSTGSLGQGLSAALGMAVGARIMGKSFATYAIVGDGEMQEGQIWEALMYAGAHNVNNLVVIVDYNRVQLEMFVSEMFGKSGLAGRLDSFGFNVVETDGHDVERFAAAIDAARAEKNRPTAIVAGTVKGKGVSFMENLYQWHGKTPSDAEFDKAFEELLATKKELEALA